MQKQTPEAKLLFLFQIIAHVGSIYGIIVYQPIDIIISLMIYFFTGCLGMSITYHRLLSHRSFKTPKFIEYVGTLFGIYGLVGSSLAWVATHRKHHKFTDTVNDPHSPLYKGKFNVQYLSMFNNKVEIRLIPDLFRDNFHRFVHIYYFHIHLIILLFFAYFSIYGLIIYYLLPAAILWNAGSLVNTLNHLYGYRNFDTNNNSKNNIITGYLMWGEGWHNNHHAALTKSNFSNHWWELDISFVIINLIRSK